MVKCESCGCKPVCKEIENWKKYCEDHIRLRERSVLFDSEPECPYYINIGCIASSIIDTGKGVIHSKKGSMLMIDTNPYNPNGQNNDNIWVKKECRKDDPIRIKYNGLPVAELNQNCEDEITTTVEDKLKSAAKSSNECKEDEYDFLKELEKISMKNKIYFL